MIGRVIRQIVANVRRWKLRHELYNEKPERNPALAAVELNELIPFKGTHWRVVSIREQPIPVIILQPVGETRASKVARLRELRRTDKIITGLEERERAAFRKAAR